MSQGGVHVEQVAHVTVIEIDRPPNNFFDINLLRDLADIFERCDAEESCRALVLCASGKVFCAGANFNRTDSAASGGPEALYREAVRLFACKKPVVAAIQGPAIGGGLGLAMVADFRVAADEARFAANFVQLGIHAGFGLTHTLPRLLGDQRASLLLLTGRRIGADEAQRIGLVDQLVEGAQLRRAAVELASEIASGAPLAVQSTRATLRSGLAEAVQRQTIHETIEQKWLMQTSDHREGVRAMTERQPATFIGK